MLDTKEETEALINTTFLGYKYRKANNMLYSSDAVVPISLIKLYYSDKVDRLDLSSISRNFVDRYIKNESLLEDVHDKDEVAGLAEMYDTMVKMDEDSFGLFSIFQLHKKLYSKCPHPEFGGSTRTSPAHISGCPVDLYPYEEICTGLVNLREPVELLKQYAKKIKEEKDYSNIREYIKECMKIKCKLIQIHPFGDGNGRTTRCFINRLFLMAGIPPVYIKKDEKNEYKAAMTEALRHRGAKDADDDSKYDMITNFYLYKICDSIIELDINKKVREEKKQGKYEIKKVRGKV